MADLNALWQEYQATKQPDINSLWAEYQSQKTEPAQQAEPIEDSVLGEVAEPSIIGQANSFLDKFSPSGMVSNAANILNPNNPNNRINAGLIDKAAELSTFGFNDEIGAGFDAGTKYFGDSAARLMGYTPEANTIGTLYDQALQERRDRGKMASEQMPLSSAAIQLGGALFTGGVGAGTAKGTAIANSFRSGNLAARMGKMGLAGATGGAAYNIGSGENGLDNRLAMADNNFIANTAIGSAIPGAGAVLGPQFRKLADYVTKKLAVSSGEIVADKLPKELQKVYARLRADYPDDNDFKLVLNRYASKPDQTLLEAGGKRTQNLAEGSAMYPSGGARATEFFDEATGQAPERLKTAVSKTVSPSSNYYDDLDTMVASGREKAAPLYKEAFRANPSIKSPVIDNILSTPEGKASLGEAAKNMQNEMSLLAKADPEMTAMAQELNVASQGGVASGLKLKTLDYVKKSMDDSINKAYRAGDEAEARRIISLKNGLVSEIDKADKSGLYAKARATSGDYLSNKKAMDNGLNFLKEDSEIVARNFKDMGAGEKLSYKTGVVKAIRSQIDSTTDGGNVARIFNKPATRNKLKSILGENDYFKLNSEAQVVDNIFKLRNQMTGNSRTAMRQIASEEFDSQGAEILTDLVTTGGARTGLRAASKWIARRFDGLSDTSAKQVADILYEQDPKKKYTIVKSLMNQASSEGSSLRKTQAAKKLEVFYGLSDAVSLKKRPRTEATVRSLPREAA